MKHLRTLLALAFVSVLSGTAVFAETGKTGDAKSEKSACCSAPEADKAPKGCCAEKTACCGAAKKDVKKGQTPSGK